MVFVNIKISDNFTPLLRRPFSIHRVHRNEGWFEILFQVIGKGTELLADFALDYELDILGPLGNQFSIPPGINHALFVAGGLGIAPFIFLSQQLLENNMSLTLFYGNKSEKDFCCLDDFDSLDVPYVLATEDGSRGFEGKVTDLFLAKNEIGDGIHPVVYACGPKPMLQKIKEIAGQFQFPCQLSLETIMACGFGVCLGCIVNSTSPAEPYKYVCKDGPVFYSDEIDLSE